MNNVFYFAMGAAAGALWMLAIWVTKELKSK